MQKCAPKDSRARVVPKRWPSTSNYKRTSHYHRAIDGAVPDRQNASCRFCRGIALPQAREVIMRASGSIAPSERLTQFRRLEPGLQTTAPESSFAANQQFHLVANSLVELLETARREL